MQIQIVAKPELIESQEVLIKTATVLLETIKHKFSSEELTNEELTWIYAEELNPTADIYFDVIATLKVKIGIYPTEYYNWDVEPRQISYVHWITIEDSNCDQDLLSKLLPFFIGMLFSPTQWGTIMADWADVRTALYYGNSAKFMNAIEFKEHLWPKSIKVLSMVLLLNEDLLNIKSKMDNAFNAIPQYILSNDLLGIMNITNIDNMPKTNMLLLIYKDAPLNSLSGDVTCLAHSNNKLEI